MWFRIGLFVSLFSNFAENPFFSFLSSFLSLGVSRFTMRQAHR